MLSRLASCFVPVLVLAAAACGTVEGDVGGAGQAQREGGVIPLKEVSGLAKMGDRFVAVGDRTTAIVSFRMKDGVPTDAKQHKPLPKAGKKGSQYEAVDVDGAGHAVVLSEAGDVVVLSADLEREEASATLNWDTAIELLGGAPLEKNSGAEGMVVLDDGHMLVALEKAPSAIIEFGPKGAEAKGFMAGTTRATKAFTPPAELVALKVWKIQDARIPDVSDLEIGPDGALWAVTQQGNRLVRFEKQMDVDENKANAREYIELPAQISGAEGLAFDGTRPLVARDRAADTKRNLYVLDPIAIDDGEQ